MEVSPAPASEQNEKSGNLASEERCELGTQVVVNEPSQQELYTSVIDGPANISNDVSNCFIPEQSETHSAVIFNNSIIEQVDLPHKNKVSADNSDSEELGSQPEIVTKKPLAPPMCECPKDKSENSHIEVLVLPPEDAARISLSELRESPTSGIHESLNNEKLGSASEDATRSSNNGNLDLCSQDDAKDSGMDIRQPDSECATKDFTIKEINPPQEDATKGSSLEQSEPTVMDELKESNQSAHKEKRTYSKRFRSVATDRVLRSREKPKAPEPSTPEPNTDVVNASAGGEKKRKKRKRKREHVLDEFSRMRTHLRYLLNRIRYEQNLIDAYSGEGWKGLSVEKLRPEKELQRATSEIFRCKLKIRDLFQRLDSLCREGSFPESLFDSEGQIDSEDIYCAKCGSKDLSAGNDIILCDGACDRGFHQLCLAPPLLTEEIPPDDEGWLCPGCDCKDDCLDLLNDAQGTNLSLSDKWEKVFPEAAAAAAAGGNMQNENFGYPSDDSEDNDYDPDNVEVNKKVENAESSSDGSSSDESDFTSSSEEFEAPANHDPLLGLPSDDSEDGDYDPDAPDRSEQVKQGSSSSDFTSDSEDLDTNLDNTRSSGKGRKKKESINDELLTVSETDIADSAPVSVKRRLEILDYKKLYEETYKNENSDSSDDEDWTDTSPSTKRKIKTRKVSPESQSGKIPISNGNNTENGEQNLQKAENTLRRICLKLNSEGINDSPSGSHKDSSGPSSTGKKGPYKRLGEAVTQGLYQAFKENQYPDRAAKENIAIELGLTYQQVDKWFGNARWSWRHSGKEATVDKTVPDKGTPSPKSKGQLDPMQEMNKNGVKITELPQATGESIGQKSTTPNTRKRKSKPDLGSEVTPMPPIEQKSGTANSKRKMNKSVFSSVETPKPLADTPNGQKSATSNSGNRKSNSVLNAEETPKPAVGTPSEQKSVISKSRGRKKKSVLGSEETPKPSAGIPTEQKSVAPNSRGRKKKSVLGSEETTKPSAGTPAEQKSVTPNSRGRKKKTVIGSEETPKPAADTPSEQKSVTPKTRGRKKKSVLGNKETPEPAADTPNEQKSVTPNSREGENKSVTSMPSADTSNAHGIQMRGRYQTRSRQSIS